MVAVVENKLYNQFYCDIFNSMPIRYNRPEQLVKIPVPSVDTKQSLGRQNFSSKWKLEIPIYAVSFFKIQLLNYHYESEMFTVYMDWNGRYVFLFGQNSV